MNINDEIKNIIVLNNLPSNIVDEAIIVINNKSLVNNELKEIKKECVVQTISNNDIKKLKSVSTNNKEYVIKEAENVVNDYINRIVNKGLENKNNKLEQKYSVLKYLCSILTISSLISTLLFILK